MREILFRGKRIDNGEWVEGYVYSFPPICRIRRWLPVFKRYGDADVNPSTVGQYTGLTDKNGKRIFEGDVVEANISGGIHQGFSWGNQAVVFVRGCFCLENRQGETTPLSSYAPCVEMEVVGNIHDNHELLEGGSDNA